MAKLILNPEKLANLSHDERMKLLNHQRRLFERKIARAKQERLLIKSKHTSRVLYAIAYFGNSQIEFLYMHATNQSEARYQAKAAAICPGCLIDIAPAIGMWLTDEKKGIVTA